MQAINMRFANRSVSLGATQPGSAESARRGEKCAGPRLRTSAGAIAFAAGMVVALAATAHAQILSSSRQPGEPTASWPPVNDHRISLAVKHDDLRQARPLDSHLQRLYDEVMSRVGESYPR
jgi:hypothetical protein